MLTYAIPDIHGMFAMLKTMLGAIEAEADGRDHRIVFLGDYGDRGPHSRLVIDCIRQGPSDPACKDWVLLQGNHDRMLVDAVLGTGSRHARDEWEYSGGRSFRKEYADGYADPAIHEDAAFLSALRVFFVDEMDRIFVHAGLEPGIALESQIPFDMQWIREGFLDSEFDHGGLVIHGHTITRSGYPEVRTNRVGLDTGAFMKLGTLTVAAFDDDSVWPSHFLRLDNAFSEEGNVTRLACDAPIGRERARHARSWTCPRTR